MTALVYLSGPISGQTVEQAQNWRLWVQSKLAPGIKAVNPLRGKDELLERFSSAGKDFGAAEEYREFLNCDPRAIVTRDRFDTSTADMMLVNLLDASSRYPSIGTLIELGWADAARVPIVLVAKKHLGEKCWWSHPFVLELAGWWVEDLADGVAVVNAALRPRAGS